jgi:hypothetical protein
MKSEKETNNYAPWELEHKKKKEQKKGIPPSNEKSRLHSRPKSKDHSHLEMYVLAREKERLEKYGSTLGRRVKSIATMWKETKARMYEMQRKSAKVGKEGIEEQLKKEDDKKNEKKKNKGNMQKVDWEY